MQVGRSQAQAQPSNSAQLRTSGSRSSQLGDDAKYGGGGSRMSGSSQRGGGGLSSVPQGEETDSVMRVRGNRVEMESPHQELDDGHGGPDSFVRVDLERPEEHDEEDQPHHQLQHHQAERGNVMYMDGEDPEANHGVMTFDDQNPEDGGDRMDGEQFGGRFRHHEDDASEEEEHAGYGGRR